MTLLYRFYLAAIAGLGAISLLVAACEILSADLPPRFWIDGVIFLVLGLALMSMMARLPGAGRSHAAPFFAPLLLLGPEAATLLSALAGLISLAIWAVARAVRRVRLHARGEYADPVESGRPVEERLFCTVWSATVITCAGGVFTLAGGTAGTRLIPEQIGPLLGAAIMLLLCEVLLEESDRALRLDRPLLAAWRNGLLFSVPVAAAVVGLGLLFALLHQLPRPQQFGTKPLLAAMVIALTPCGLLYYSFRLYLEMRRAYDRTLRTLAGLVESRICSPTQMAQQSRGVPALGETTRLVERWAVAVAEQLGLPPKETEQIRYAAYLLELGKIGIPRSLLTRGSFVSSRQRKAHAHHVVLANQILEPVEFLRPVGMLILHHQERYDGLGGPSGLRGTDIPLGSRILCVVHALVEMTTGEETGYRMDLDRALERLRAGRGIRFDPKLVDVLSLVARQQAAIAFAAERGAFRGAVLTESQV